jgi:predicted GNAT superfamily acetyltransferase
MSYAIRDAVRADHAAILALNLESEALLSPMDAARLQLLEQQAAYHRVAVDAEHVAAFLLAFREGAEYDSPNYRWFAARYEHFLYVDRIVVSGQHQGRGLGATMYADLFEFARAQGIPRVVCEYDCMPLNQASQRFHARAGFTEVGTQWLPDRSKQVSFQLAST